MFVHVTKCKNFLLMFGDTFLLKGGLNQMVFLSLLLFLLFGMHGVNFKDVENLLPFNAVSYTSFVELKISLFDGFSDNLLEMDRHHICHIIGHEWFDEVCMD